MRILLIIALIFGLSAGVLGQPNDPIASDILETNIHELPWYTMFDWITAEVNDNNVILKGYALRPLLKISAEKEISKIPNVKSIKNEIEILPFSLLDDQIRLELYNSFFDKDSPLHKYSLDPNSNIHIIVNHGSVYLKGSIDNKNDNALLFMKARQIVGVVQVENELKINKTTKRIAVGIVGDLSIIKRGYELKQRHEPRHVSRRKHRRR